MRSFLVLGCLLAGILLTIPTPAARAASRELKATIRDPWGHPVPGAILYVEAWVGNGKTYDFAFARAGAHGEIPAEGTAPASIAWRRETRLAYLVLEADHRPVLIFDRDRHLDPSALAFTLEDLDPNWPPDIRGLAYPFDDKPALARKLAEPGYAPLRSALKRYRPTPGVRLFAIEPGHVKTGAARPRLFLSTLGQGAACVWVRAKDQRRFVQFADRREDGHELVTDLVLSPDGTRFAFTYLKDRTQLRPGLSPAPHLSVTTRPVYVNVDGETQGPFASAYHLGFSDDSRDFWFSFVDEQGRKGVWSKGQRRFERVSEIEAAADGSFVTWTLKRDGKLSVHVNGRDWGGYDALLRSPARTEDCAHVWFQAKEAGRVVVWVDGRSLGPFDDAGPLNFLPGGDGTWFVYQDGGRRFLNIDGQPFGEIEAERGPLIRPDGSLAGWLRRSRGQWFVDLDEQRFGGFESLGPVQFSPDGRRFGFAYSDKTGHYLSLSGRPLGLPLARMSSHGEAVFSADLRRGAFSFERGGKAYVFVDGREIPAGESVSRMGFSPDSKRFWFLSSVVRDGRRRTRLQVDEQRFGDYDFAEPPDFSPDGRRFWFRYTQQGEQHIHSAGHERRLATFLGGHWLHSSPDHARWAFSYVQNYPDDPRRHIDVDGHRLEVAIAADPDLSGFAPHALALLPAGGAALLSLDEAGHLRRRVFETAGRSASPAVEVSLPKEEFLWGEPVPLSIRLRNPTDLPQSREDPARSTKTLIHLRRKRDDKGLSLSLSGVKRVEPWHGRGPYPVPAIKVEPRARLEYEIDLLERFILSSGKAVLLQPAAGDWEIHVQDRGQKSEPIALRFRLTRASIPLLLAMVEDRARDARMRAWAMAWLRVVVAPHIRGYFTEAAPWECVAAADQARAEKTLSDQLLSYRRWWKKFGPTEEAERCLQSLGTISRQ